MSGQDPNEIGSDHAPVFRTNHTAIVQYFSVSFLAHANLVSSSVKDRSNRFAEIFSRPLICW